MQVSQQIRMRREALGLSVRELADRVGSTAAAVRLWENGTNFPSRDFMKAIEKALACSIYWYGTANPKAVPATASVTQEDYELLAAITRLPAHAKQLVGELVRMHLEAVDEVRAVRSRSPSPSAKAPRKATAAAR